MATQLQLRRGTTAENDAFTGAVGEVTVDTDTSTLRVHDGSTTGGFMVDTVVAFQAPTALNNYTWYRKYADGWVEQGGIKNQASTSAQALTMPVEMAGSTYSVLTSVMDDTLSNYVFCVKVTNKTTTGFNTTVWGSYQGGTATSGYDFVWEVKGMASQGV